jgi:signal transduction histidine kinase
MFEYLCSDGTGFNKLFDLSIAPSFLYYSYVPIILLCITLGFFVLKSGRDKILNKKLFYISLVYALFLINELLHWILIPVVLVHFFWQITTLIHALLFYCVYLFFYYLMYERKISFNHQAFVFLLITPIVLFLPTVINIQVFDFEYCEGNYSWLVYYLYIVEITFLVLIARLSIKKIIISKNRIKDVLFSVATIVFLGIFIVTNVWGDSTLLYEVNILGPLGMLLFIILMMFTVVRYRTFNIKLQGPQALVLILGFLTFAALFIRKTINIRIILIVNLVAIGLIGYFLVKSVKKVDHQRELLDVANKNQESLLHFITHQVKGYMTKSRNIFDGMVTGDYGELAPKTLEMAKYGFDSDTRGVETVMAILKASDLKTGKTEFKKEKTNLSALVAEVVEFRKEMALNKGLDFTFEIEPNVYTLVDMLQIKEVFKNLITNAILYTQKGTVHVVLKHEGIHIRFAVIDTGVGLTAKDKQKLFTEGGKGEDSIAVNVDSTGYGLYIAKKIVQQHEGTIGALSEGRDKGSEFFVILPDIL